METTMFIGTKVIIPAPLDGDTWDAVMVTEIDDITDSGMIIFFDDNWDEHEIEKSRVQLYKGENNY